MEPLGSVDNYGSRRVREELGGTYSIRVRAANSRFLPDPEYQVSVVFGSDPSRAEELLEEVDWLRVQLQRSEVMPRGNGGAPLLGKYSSLN